MCPRRWPSVKMFNIQQETRSDHNLGMGEVSRSFTDDTAVRQSSTDERPSRLSDSRLAATVGTNNWSSYGRKISNFAAWEIMELACDSGATPRSTPNRIHAKHPWQRKIVARGGVGDRGGSSPARSRQLLDFDADGRTSNGRRWFGNATNCD